MAQERVYADGQHYLPTYGETMVMLKNAPVEDEDHSILKHPICRSAIKYTVVNIGLFILTCLYAVMGAMVFKAIEGPVEQETYKTFVELKDASRTEIIDELVDLTGYTSRIDLRNLLDSYERKVEEISGCTVIPTERFEPQWNFPESLFFSVVVMTTIGYGNLAPVTVEGRIFCMFYAVFGIALLLLVLASIGSLLARGATMSYRYFKVFLQKDNIGNNKREKEFVREVPKSSVEGTSHNAVVEDNNGMVVTRLDSEVSKDNNKPISPFFDPNVDYGRSIDPEDPTKLNQVKLEEIKLDGDDRVTTPDIQGVEEHKQTKHDSIDEIFGDEEAGTNIPLLAILLFAVVYMCLLAALLTVWEDWTYFEALYFSFITLTTIGFGDLVPQHQKNLLACVFLIMVGMAVMSMCIALAQEEIMSKVRQIGKFIGLIITKRRQSKRKK